MDKRAERKPLTKRQQEIINLLAAGLQDKQIGIALGITTQTVKNHIYGYARSMGILERLGAVNRANSIAIWVSESQERQQC